MVGKAKPNLIVNQNLTKSGLRVVRTILSLFNDNSSPSLKVFVFENIADYNTIRFILNERYFVTDQFRQTILLSRSDLFGFGQSTAAAV